jgi:hypothetical protein
MIASSILAILALIGLFDQGQFLGIVSVPLYLLAFLQTILAINILNNNYPDVPVTGKQKTSFNRLFLLNFFFLAFLFGIIFYQYRVVNDFARLLGRPVRELPFQLFIDLRRTVSS